MRKEIKQNMIDDKKKYIDQLVRDEALEKASDFVEAEIPNAMVERELEITVDDFDKRLRRNGSNVETYLKTIKRSMEDIRNEMKPSAEKRLRSKLLLRKIVEEEKIEASDEEVNKEIADMAASTNKTFEEVKKTVNKDGEEAIKEFVMRRKAVDHIVSKVKIEEKKGE